MKTIELKCLESENVLTSSSRYQPDEHGHQHNDDQQGQ